MIKSLLWPSSIVGKLLNNQLSMMIVMIVISIIYVNLISARSYYPPPSKYENNQRSRIKLNLGLHVPPIIVKLPRMEMPQLVIGANLIKNPKAQPLVLNMPPPPSISFGDSKYDHGSSYGGGGGGAGYQYAASGSSPTSDTVKPNEYGLDLKAFSSDQYQNMMYPQSSSPQPPQYTPYPHPHQAMMPPPPPPPQSQHYYSQQSSEQYNEQPIPPMMPPPHMMPPPPPPPSMHSMQPYPPQQPPYYTPPPTMEPPTMPNYHPVERMSGYDNRMMMAMSSNQHQQMIPPPFKAPFQLVKNFDSNKDYKFRLKTNADIYENEQLISAFNNDSDQNEEDYSKDYNAAPKISMPKYQHRNN